MGFLGAVARATSPAANDGNVEALLARMDGVWERRDAYGTMPDLVSLAMIAQNMDPQNYEVEWRLARAYFWVAYTQSHRIAKKAMAVKAMETAERARSWRPDRVEGHYFYAIAVGEYGGTVGVVPAVIDGIAGKVESAALRAAEIDRDFDHGAPLTVLGRYYFMVPWPKRDLARSRRYLEETVTRHPDTLIARDYLADTYYALGEHEKAREQLIVVLTSDVTPGREPERPAPKALAREAMQRWFPESLPETRPEK
jgi:hypothetical protein